MNKLNLMIGLGILCCFIINESLADIIVSGDDCAASDGISTCHWEVDSEGKLTITGSGMMKDYSYRANGDPNAVMGYSNNTPWEYLNVKQVEVQGVNYIGTGAFFQLPTINSVIIGDSVKSTGFMILNAYNDNYAAKLDLLVLPSNLSTVGFASFAHTQISTIVMPDDMVPSNFLEVLNTNRTSENIKIACLGNITNCQNIIGSTKVAEIVSATETQCNISANYYWSGKSCNNKKNGIVCAEGFKRIEDFCNRVRYTPAEAAKITKDDGNVVTITFRK